MFRFSGMGLAHICRHKSFVIAGLSYPWRPLNVPKTNLEDGKQGRQPIKLQAQAIKLKTKFFNRLLINRERNEGGGAYPNVIQVYS